MIPPPHIPQRPTPPPAVESPAPAEEASRELPTWRRRWNRAVAVFGEWFDFKNGALALDPIELFSSVPMMLVGRFVKMVGVIGIGIAIGVWSWAWGQADWRDVGSYPIDVIDFVTHTSLREMVFGVFLGYGAWAASFLLAFHAWWTFALWAASGLVQIAWMHTAMTDEENDWSAPAAVVGVAVQVFSLGFVSGHDVGPLGPVFLLGCCAVVVCSVLVRRWMIRIQLTPWEIFEATRTHFDPALHRWGRYLSKRRGKVS